MSLIQEFKKFAVKGNVVDLAVGVIIGAAFGKIVTALVSGIIMPPIGVLIGGVNFSDLTWVIKKATDSAPAVVITYGAFLQTVIDFLIIAWSVFLLVKVMNSLKKKEVEKPAAPPAPSQEQILLTEIRDILKQKNL